MRICFELSVPASVLAILDSSWLIPHLILIPDWLGESILPVNHWSMNI